jgi:hypothetical protein
MLIPRRLLRTAAGDSVDRRATPSSRPLMFEAGGSDDLGCGDAPSLTAVVLKGTGCSLLRSRCLKDNLLCKGINLYQYHSRSLETFAEGNKTRKRQ